MSEELLLRMEKTLEQLVDKLGEFSRVLKEVKSKDNPAYDEKGILTIEDIRNATFRTTPVVGGYNEDDVDKLLSMVEKTIEEKDRQLADIARRIESGEV